MMAYIYDLSMQCECGQRNYEYITSYDVYECTHCHTWYDRARVDRTRQFIPTVVYRPYCGDFVPDTCPQGAPLHRCPICMNHETWFYNIAMDRGECMACDVSREVDYAEMDGMTMDEGFAALAKIVKEQKDG